MTSFVQKQDTNHYTSTKNIVIRINIPIETKENQSLHTTMPHIARPSLRLLVEAHQVNMGAKHGQAHAGLTLEQ